jgi:ribosomal protein L35
MGKCGNKWGKFMRRLRKRKIVKFGDWWNVGRLLISVKLCGEN